MLTQTQAKSLTNSITSLKLNQIQTPNSTPLFSISDSTHLEATRKQIIDRESKLVDVPGLGPVRIFPPKNTNIFLDKYHVLGRGIDTARAVIEILKHVKPQNPQAKHLFEEALRIFQREIHDPAVSLNKAREALKRFNGAMASLLCKAPFPVCGSLKSAKTAINFVRDFIWKKTWQSESFCTVVPGITNPNTGKQELFLRFAKPMEVKQSDWNDILQSKWYSPLKKTLGHWFQSFVRTHHAELVRLSTTPMTRSIPNPSNAFDSSFIAMDSQSEVKQIFHHTQVAITEPFKVKNRSERTRLTTLNHQALVFGDESFSRLKSTLQRHFSTWEGLVEHENKTTIPILHQTLIADSPTGAFNVTPDMSKSKTMLDNRERANQTLRKQLNNYFIYRNRSNGEIILDKKADNINRNSTRYENISVSLLETNNCVNQHHRYSRVRNNDIDHSRELVRLAADQIAGMVNNIANLSPRIKDDFRRVIQFLRSSNSSSMTPYKSRGKEVKKSLERISQYLRTNPKPLRNHQNKIISQPTRNNLALLTLSTVELKCTVHETRFGAARRRFNNAIDRFSNGIAARLPWFSNSAPGRWLAGACKFLLDAVTKFPVWLVAQSTKIVTAPIGLAKWSQHRASRRRTVHKAANEALVAGLSGTMHGGCMSSADRATEVNQLMQAQIRSFNAEGRILGFNDGVKAKKRFMMLYGTTQEKHNYNLMATGTPATNDRETRGLMGTSGLFSEGETRAEQNLSSSMSGLRKGQYAQISIDRYILSTTVVARGLSAQNPRRVVAATHVQAASVTPRVLPVGSLNHSSSANDEMDFKHSINLNL